MRRHLAVLALTLALPFAACADNTAPEDTLEGTYTWYASYGGDSNNNTAVSNCVETFSIDN